MISFDHPEPALKKKKKGKSTWCCNLVIPTLPKERNGGPSCSLASQSSLLGERKVHDIFYLKKLKCITLEERQMKLFFGLHIYDHICANIPVHIRVTAHIHTHTCTQSIINLKNELIYIIFGKFNGFIHEVL